MFYQGKKRDAYNKKELKSKEDVIRITRLISPAGALRNTFAVRSRSSSSKISGFGNSRFYTYCNTNIYNIRYLIIDTPSEYQMIHLPFFSHTSVYTFTYNNRTLEYTLCTLFIFQNIGMRFYNNEYVEYGLLYP